MEFRVHLYSPRTLPQNPSVYSFHSPHWVPDSLRNSTGLVMSTQEPLLILVPILSSPFEYESTTIADILVSTFVGVLSPTRYLMNPFFS